mmetsp:Transcript_123218/g.282496  ORF Transcript_123218/g.282496 Transcript_123218/m.282496 type:complete len:259 (-) Transcript_123218:401-1177(-)
MPHKSGFPRRTQVQLHQLDGAAEKSQLVLEHPRAGLLGGLLVASLAPRQGHRGLDGPVLSPTGHADPQPAVIPGQADGDDHGYPEDLPVPDLQRALPTGYLLLQCLQALGLPQQMPRRSLALQQPQRRLGQLQPRLGRQRHQHLDMIHLPTQIGQHVVGLGDVLEIFRAIVRDHCGGLGEPSDGRHELVHIHLNDPTHADGLHGTSVGPMSPQGSITEEVSLADVDRWELRHRARRSIRTLAKQVFAVGVGVHQLEIL